MERIRVSDQWTAAGSVADVQAAANAFLRIRGMQITGEQPGEVHGRRRGSWLARLLGRLAPARWLPHRAEIRLQTRPTGVGVRAEVESAADDPDTAPAAGYHAMFDRWMTDLRRALPAAVVPA